MADHEPLNLSVKDGQRQAFSLDVKLKLGKRALALKEQWQRQCENVPELDWYRSNAGICYQHWTVTGPILTLSSMFTGLLLVNLHVCKGVSIITFMQTQ